jgi:hypothetical protein
MTNHLSLLDVSVGDAPAPLVTTAQSFGGDEYMLMAKHSGKCLDVACMP